MKTNIELAREADPGFEGGPDADGTMGDSLVGIAAIDRYTGLVEARLMAKLLEGAGEPLGYAGKHPVYTPDQIAAAVLQKEQENLKSYLKLAEVNRQQAVIISDLREEITAWRNRGTK